MTNTGMMALAVAFTVSCSNAPKNPAGATAAADGPANPATSPATTTGGNSAAPGSQPSAASADATTTPAGTTPASGATPAASGASTTASAVSGGTPTPASGSGGVNLAAPPSGNPTTDVVNAEALALSTLPTGAAQLKVLCGRPGGDKVRQVFCGATPPTITGLTELQTALGLNFTTANATGTNSNAIKQGNGNQGNPAFVLTGHSSSLVARFTSAINPRAIIFTPTGVGLNPGTPDPNFVAMGFARGEQFAEISANDPTTNVPAFFLVRFQQACNSTPGGCPIGDLVTPAIEQNWTGISIYEDVDLADTVFDCLQCHQSGGPAAPKKLRMQERKNPWTHFFRDDRPGGQALLADFQMAHGTAEAYAGIPPAIISSSDPLRLERLIEGNKFDQPSIPNEFTTGTIENEVTASNKAEPVVNIPPGVSQTWQALYTGFTSGSFIAMPYHDVKITDATLLVPMTTAYQGFLKGTTPASELPDIRNVLLASRAYEMGFAVNQGETGEQILTTACTQCHNSTLDQTISRAKFNVNLTLMSAAEKQVAITRINLPLNDPKHMPPARFRDLSAADIATLTTLLNQ